MLYKVRVIYWSVSHAFVPLMYLAGFLSLRFCLCFSYSKFLFKVSIFSGFEWYLVIQTIVCFTLKKFIDFQLVIDNK